MHGDALVVSQLMDGMGVNAVFVNQCIGGDVLPLHGVPEWPIADHRYFLSPFFMLLFPGGIFFPAP